MIKDKALKLALEALENHCGNYKLDATGQALHKKAITVIREALAAPVQEPECKETGVCVQTGLACFGQAARPEQVDCPRCGHVCSQRPWVGLTEDEVLDVFTEKNALKFAANIEAKLKELNT
jgi:hypothetical protein